MCGLAPNSSRILTAPASPLAAAQDSAVRPSASVSSIVDVDNSSCFRRSLFTRPRTVLWIGGKVRDSKYSSSSNRQRQASIVQLVADPASFPPNIRSHASLMALLYCSQISHIQWGVSQELTHGFCLPELGLPQYQSRIESDPDGCC
jgi:hypothetical protein